MDEVTTGPTDGSAAHLQDDSACIVAGCVEPPVTHRQMRVSLPIMGKLSDGTVGVKDRQEQTIDAALCEVHNEMLVADRPVSVAINEQSGAIE